MSGEGAQALRHAAAWAPAVEQHDDVHLERVEAGRLAAEIVETARDGPLHDGVVRVRLVRQRRVGALEQVLVDPEPLVEHPEGRVKPARDRVQLVRVATLVVDAVDLQHQADVPRLREKDALLAHKPPERQLRMQGARLGVVLENLGEIHHVLRTSTAMGSYFPGS